MRIIALIILIFGVALAGGAVFFASDRFDKLQAALQQQAAAIQPAAPTIETIQVVVATRSLKYGQPLEEKHLKVVEFPKDSAPANSFISIEELVVKDGDQRIVLRSVEPNEPVLKSKVTGFGERATISAQLTPGMRAFTLRIDSVSGVAGFLLPNDRVDIFLTRGSQDGLAANLIMQNVKVIAIDQFSDKESNQARVARTATVEVTPDDAQRLALTQQVGRISMSLREIDEATMKEETSAMRLEDIIKTEPEAGPAPAAPKKPCTRKGVELICPAG